MRLFKSLLIIFHIPLILLAKLFKQNLEYDFYNYLKIMQEISCNLSNSAQAIVVLLGLVVIQLTILFHPANQKAKLTIFKPTSNLLKNQHITTLIVLVDNYSK